MYDFTNEQVRSLTRGVRVALGFGIATSITANVIHSLTRPDLAHLVQWQVWASAGLAALAPLVLFVSTEMVTRIPVHSKVLGGFRLVITLVIAGFSGWVSYWHMVGVCELLGETGGAQFIYPLIIDGMMVVATISLIELGRIASVVMAANAPAVAVKVNSKITKAEEQARKRAGYDDMNRAAKAKWSKTYRDRASKRERTDLVPAMRLEATEMMAASER